MESKKKLLRCLNCMNHVECWGLNQKERTSNKDPREIKISVDAICDNLKQLNPKTLDELNAYIHLLYIKTMLPEDADDYIRRNVLHTSVCVLEGLIGVNKNTWLCPDAWEYKPIIWG